MAVRGYPGAVVIRIPLHVEEPGHCDQQENGNAQDRIGGASCIERGFHQAEFMIGKCGAGKGVGRAIFYDRRVGR
jgi:hypothetical protein